MGEWQKPQAELTQARIQFFPVGLISKQSEQICLSTFSFSFNQKKIRPFTASHTPNTSEIARKETKTEEPISDQRAEQRQLSFSNVTMEGQNAFGIYEVNSLTIN